jgi:hypothetical protein
MATTKSDSKPTAAAVQPSAAPAAAPVAAKSDRYRVKGPGGVWAGDRLYEAGAELTLSESDALSVIEHIEPA